jgi:hypothetical protein
VHNPPSFANLAILLFAALTLSDVSTAQLIDTKDASNISLAPTKARTDTTSFPGTQGEDCFTDHYDGFVKRKRPETLHLEIVSADAHFNNDTTEIVATVRIRNDGHWPVVLPWQTDPVVPATTGGPDDEVSYEGGTLRLKLGTQKYRNNGALLEGEVGLEAVPHSDEQHVRLLRGQWVEVRFRVAAKCWLNAADPPLCSEFKTDEHARLTAQYSEWLFTRRGEGCKAVTSSAQARRIKSDPIEIDFVAATPLGTGGDTGLSHQEKENQR